MATRIEKERLFEHLYKTIRVRLNPDEIDISLPLDWGKGGSPLNTEITIAPVAGSPYSGMQTLHYERTHIADIITRPLGTPLTNQTQLSDLIEMINLEFGLDLQTEDYYDTSIPPSLDAYPTAPRKVTIAIKTSSYLYKGVVDLECNPLRIPPPLPDNPTNLLYFFIGGFDLTDIKRSFRATNHLGVTLETFDFLNNVESITQFSVSEIVPIVNNEFVFTGAFEFIAITPTGDYIPVAANTIIIDRYGAFITGYMTTWFPSTDGDPLIYNEAKTLFYRIDRFPSEIKRYQPEGTLDQNFHSPLGYTPRIMRLDSEDRLYTVSPSYLGPTPYSQTLSNIVRVHRLLPSGELDVSFANIYITAPYDATINVIDIGFTSDGFYLCLQPIDGLSATSLIPSINNTPLISTTLLSNEKAIWNPIVKFNIDGSLVDDYQTYFTGIREEAFYDSRTGRVPNHSNAIHVTPNHLIFITLKNNPITGIRHRQPLALTHQGHLEYLNGADYQNQIAFKRVDYCLPVLDGFILSGLFEDRYGSEEDCLALYGEKGEPIRLIWRESSEAYLSDLTLSQVFSIHGA